MEEAGMLVVLLILRRCLLFTSFSSVSIRPFLFYIFRPLSPSFECSFCTKELPSVETFTQSCPYHMFVCLFSESFLSHLKQVHELGLILYTILLFLSPVWETARHDWNIVDRFIISQLKQNIVCVIFPSTSAANSLFHYGGLDLIMHDVNGTRTS